ncbi:LysR family transcriptional regulator [Pandoraea sp. CB10b_02]|uniref:LysR family transcriptional regulator n=1 Tax=Pandoraea sp. CB10b_02 TaxID=2014535 RepID=UPI00257CEA21|nr:LysR family transcriptional regulator [Pandoraea sp. CB10b_02]
MRTFVLLVDAGSFARTAEQLDQTPSQITRAISSLEAHLGIRLLHRTTRAMSLTPAGEQYLRRTREVIAAIDQSEREARGTGVHARGRLRVHCSASIANRLLIPLVEPFGRAHPEVALDLTIGPRAPDLIREPFDVAFVAARSLAGSELVGIELGRIRNVLCAAPEYIARHGTPAQPPDLLQHRCLQLMAPEYDDSLWCFGDARDAPLKIDPFLTVDTSASLVIATRQGTGIALLPWFVVEDDLEDGRLVELLPQFPPASLSLYLLYASRRHLDAKIRAWVDFIRPAIRRRLAPEADAMPSTRERAPS